MPCTRSMRSKTNMKEKKEDMPPPEPSPPKTRTRGTRSKKIKEEPVEVSAPSSPAASASSSTRSKSKAPKKAKGKVKPEPVVEVMDLVSSPEAPPVTRSGRSKTAASKTSKSSKTKKDDDSVKTASKKVTTAKKVMPKIEKQEEVVIAASSSSRGRGRPKTKRAAPIVESTSDELSDGDEEMIAANATGKLPFEYLKATALDPFKTFFQALDVDLDKLKGQQSCEEQQREFEAVLNEATAMPPPPPPAPKGRGRPPKAKAAKRVRSPDKIPSKTDVPKCFDFAQKDTETLAPAKKKMILDIPTSDEELLPVSSSGDESSSSKELQSGSTSKGDASSSEKRQPIETNEDHDGVSENLEAVSANNDDAGSSEKVNAVRASKDESGSSSEKQKVVRAKKDEPDSSSEKQKGVRAKKDEVDSSSEKQTAASARIIKDDEVSSEKLDLIHASKDEAGPSEKLNAVHTGKNDADSSEKLKAVGASRDDAGSSEKLPSTANSGNKGGLAKEMQLNAPTLKKKMDETYVCDTPPNKVTTSNANETFTPELFGSDTPKCQALDRTVTIPKSGEAKLDADIEKQPNGQSSVSVSGIVSSLVNFFDMSKKDKQGSNKATTPNSDNKIEEHKETPKTQDPNATYVLPQDSKTEESQGKGLNVTVSLKKMDSANFSPQENSGPSPLMVPILPPQAQTTSSLLFSQDLSRTFVKEPPLAAVVEEEDEGAFSTKSEKVRPPIVKPKDVSKKGISSSSSSSSTCSMKSASSQPNLSSSSKKLVAGSSGKNGPIHGSAGKLNEISKSKALEEAERRKQELIRQRQENSKKKMEEWKKKTEKNKLEEEQKKQKIIQQASSNLQKKPIIPTSTQTVVTGTISKAKGPAASGSGFLKPKLNFGPATISKPFSAVPTLPPSLPKQGFNSKPVPVPESDNDLDDSFKTASPPNSFMDCTADIGHLSSYDITVYEDLDEDLRHRENKTIPTWASDKEALKIALFSMVLLPDYQHRLPDPFPRPDKSYKLFPNKNIPM